VHEASECDGKIMRLSGIISFEVARNDQRLLALIPTDLSWNSRSVSELPGNVRNSHIQCQ